MSTRILHPLTALCLAALILLVYPTGALAADLPPDQADWVCIVPDGFRDAYAPLAAHRAAQGLTTRIVVESELYAWAPMEPGDTARLRAAAEAMHLQWGTRYLLLGGDQGDLPEPTAATRARCGPGSPRWTSTSAVWRTTGTPTATAGWASPRTRPT